MDSENIVNPSIKESLDPSMESPGASSSRPRLVPPPVTEVSELPTKKSPISKKLKCGIICCGIGLVVFIAVAAAMPFIIDRVILSMAAEMAVMKQETENLWSNVPGLSEAEFIREFSFFNFSNWEDFYFYGAKPQFT